MKQWLTMLLFVLSVSGCKIRGGASATAMNPTADKGEEQAPDQPSCYDSRLVRVKCHDGQVFSHAGCEDPEYMKRCASCIQIAAMMCGPGTMAVEVPECPRPGEGDCVPQGE